MGKLPRQEFKLITKRIGWALVVLAALATPAAAASKSSPIALADEALSECWRFDASPEVVTHPERDCAPEFDKLVNLAGRAHALKIRAEGKALFDRVTNVAD